jgi:hypothetical protein
VISVITITGIGDHLQPVWLITFTGMRNWDAMIDFLGARAIRGIEAVDNRWHYRRQSHSTVRKA